MNMSIFYWRLISPCNRFDRFWSSVSTCTSAPSLLWLGSCSASFWIHQVRPIFIFNFINFALQIRFCRWYNYYHLTMVLCCWLNYTTSHFSQESIHELRVDQTSWHLCRSTFTKMAWWQHLGYLRNKVLSKADLLIWISLQFLLWIPKNSSREWVFNQKKTLKLRDVFW